MRLNLLTASALLILILPISVSAQSLGNSAGDAPFTVSVNPQYPAPYSQASLSFLSASLDLTNALLAVSVAGKETYRGTVQPDGITLGKAGSATNVKVTISSGGVNYTQTIFIQPQDVAIIA